MKQYGIKGTWAERLSGDVYDRLCSCSTKKTDVKPLVDAKWAHMRTLGKDRDGFTKEDALISILELLDSNSVYIELTHDEYTELMH